MELQQQSLRELAFCHHDPAELVLPAVPKHDLQSARNSVQLPALRAVLSPEFDQVIRTPAPLYENGLPSMLSPVSTHSLPRMDVSSQHSRSSTRLADSSIQSPTDIGFAQAGEARGRRPLSVISMEDPDVRIAAEALSGLGSMDFIRSPTKQSVHSSPIASGPADTHMPHTDEEPEPLLELFTQAHPWVGNTINGSVYAYNTTKHYSPRFIQYSANLVERSIATPMAQTVGTVGKFTGVEDGLRRYLGGVRRSSDIESAEDSVNKRLLAARGLLDGDTNGYDDLLRRDSYETLPAYRPSKPPSYREEYSPAVTNRNRSGSDRPPIVRSWPSQFAGQVFVMTSGLGVALSVTSRRSLQFCLSLLSQATEHVATVMNALKMVLEQYDQARVSWHQQQHNTMTEKVERPRTPDHDEAARRLAELIKQHCDDIWQTLKTVVNTVSNSAGGALPENARHFVRTQLMSLPQRWRVVSEQQAGESETSRGAHRMIAFATEGLDMMSQVSQVMKATLDSAERWLERAGRRNNDRSIPSEKDYDIMDVDTPRNHPV